jgi:predicted alpha/beta hydrolase
MDSFEIVTGDGVRLPASLFDVPEPRAVVIVSPATATPRGFYHAFCSYLAQCGAAAVTYDYRGTFEPPAVLRASNARMRDWGERDFAAVVRWAAQRYPNVPVHAVGHSVGGHVPLMTAENSRIARVVNVASQSGYWRLWQKAEKYKVYGFMRFVMPLLTKLCGYFPGKRIVFGTNLAPGVLREWGRWCRMPRYFLDDPTMAPVLRHARTLRADVTMIGFTDDPWATPAAIAALAEAFVAARVSIAHVDPADYGHDHIGHMGFFRRTYADTLWPLAVRALELTAPVTA